MHSITFAIPQFPAASSDAEKEGILNLVERCVGTLRDIDSRSRSFWGDEEDGEVSFLLPRVFSRGSKLRDNARAAEALLECLTRIDCLYWILRGGVSEPLYVNPLRYKRTSVWDTTPALYARGFGDCKSLACTRAAEYRLQSREARPFFRFVPPELNPEKEFMYHIVVGKDEGPQIMWEPLGTTWEDPSKVKGMGQNEWAYFEQGKNSARGNSVRGNSLVSNGGGIYQIVQAAGDFFAGFLR